MDALLESLRPLIQAHIEAEVRRQVDAVLAQRQHFTKPVGHTPWLEEAELCTTHAVAHVSMGGAQAVAKDSQHLTTSAPECDSQATQLPSEDERPDSVPLAPVRVLPTLPKEPVKSRAPKRPKDDPMLPDGTRSSFWDVGFPSDT